MSIDFDREISRSGTLSVKHDGRARMFGSADVLPLWVADMDFAVPEAVTRALAQRAAHPIYGYTLYPESMVEALIAWLKKRHGWQVPREWILMAPGVVPSLFAAVRAFARRGEGVIVQPPVYYPFFPAVTTSGRRLVENPLRETNGAWTMDFAHLEECAAGGARVLLLCSPHNPIGRVWSTDELKEVLRIARRYDLTIVSDEIHADLVFPGRQHTALALLAEAGDKVITTVAPSKTFNIPGLGLSSLIAADSTQREALRNSFEVLHSGNTNPFSIAAFEAAYRHGEAWLDSLLVYLRGNLDTVCDFLAARVPAIRAVRPEGTFLVWLDCRGLGQWTSDDAQLRAFFVDRARVGLSPGQMFGRGGSGFMRLNIASPRSVLVEALERVARAVKERRD